MPGWGRIDTGVEIVDSSVFLPNVLADIFNGESVWEWGRVGCRRGGFIQLCSDRR